MYYFIKIDFGTVGVSVGGPSITNIDTRLWAYLRILYAKSEDDITKHGYTPFSLQATGSGLSAEIEKEVVKTLVGVVGIILRVYGSDMKVIPPPLLFPPSLFLSLSISISIFEFTCFFTPISSFSFLRFFQVSFLNVLSNIHHFCFYVFFLFSLFSAPRFITLIYCYSFNWICFYFFFRL